MKRAPAWAAVAATLVLGGCGGTTRGNADGPTVGAIAETIEEFEDALASRDLNRVCERIFSSEARRRAGGAECRSSLMRTTRGLDDPRIELVSVTLGRDRARARVRASASDATPAIDSIELVPAEDGFRIESLDRG